MSTCHNKIRVAALTGGINAPAARFRVRQLIPMLSQYGIEVHEFIPSVSTYPPAQKWKRPAWGVAALAVRIPAIISTHSYNVTFLQRELISTFVTFETLTKHPRVLDVDDAIFVYRNGKTARKLAEISDLIICGNDFLADWFSQWNKNIRVLPTAVDTKRYATNSVRKRNVHNNKIIGWIGTSGNFKYLYQIELALERVLKAYPGAVLRIVSDAEPNFRIVDNRKVEFIPWSPGIEVESIQGMSIGIMPLEDSIWARGKCSFKMLQYMACGIPVVVSPIGMNKQILSMGTFGFGASTSKAWEETLLELLSNEDERLKMGLVGRNIIENEFSADVIAKKLSKYLKDVVQ